MSALLLLVIYEHKTQTLENIWCCLARAISTIRLFSLSDTVL